MRQTHQPAISRATRTTVNRQPAPPTVKPHECSRLRRACGPCGAAARGRQSSSTRCAGSTSPQAFAGRGTTDTGQTGPPTVKSSCTSWRSLAVHPRRIGSARGIRGRQPVTAPRGHPLEECQPRRRWPHSGGLTRRGPRPPQLRRDTDSKPWKRIKPIPATSRSAQPFGEGSTPSPAYRSEETR
jgi:hypothetical protein